MRILDSVPEDDKVYKAYLVEHGGMYGILHQITGRRPDINVFDCRMPEAHALSVWESLVHDMFYRVTKNSTDSATLTKRRLDSLH